MINQPSSDTKNFTRGGQITLHNLRMFFQIMDKVAIFSGLIFLCVTVMVTWDLTSEYERYICSEYFWAHIVPFLDANTTTSFIQPDGSTSIVTYADILHASLVKEIIQAVSRKVLIAMIAGILCATFSLVGISRWLKKRGERQAEDKLIKGDSIVPKEILAKNLERYQLNSDLILAGLPLIKNKETAHFYFHGTTGTGKSNAIKELLDQIRARGDRAVIYDKSCNYLQEFYQENDVLLNPLDERGEAWNLWRECRDSADFDSLASAQIPMPSSNQDPFWVNAARTIFSVTAFEMRNDPERSIMKLLRYLLTADLDLIQKYLKGTEAETLTSEKIEKTAVSIKSVLATYLKSLKYVKYHDKAFSIREWIQDEEAKNWLFVTSLGDRHETLKPLISSWLDIVANALLSLPTSQTRRIWVILDELTSLQPLPYLTQTLSESRKFGGCVVIGIQNHAQLCKLYSNDGAREISALLNTRFMFRQPDPEMAKWAATNFGESITDEVREGISYGANTMRDGISINRVETQKQMISYSEIMALADLHAYVRLPGNLPLTEVQFQYKERTKLNEAFQLRKIDENAMRDVAIKNENDTKPDESEKSFPKQKKKNKPLTKTTKQLSSLDIDDR